MVTALVLSGGGAKGSFELGVVQQLEDMGVTFDLVAGVSVGALNGLLIAQGKTDLLAKEWKSVTGPKDIFDYALLAYTGHYLNFSPSAVLKPGKLLKRAKHYANLTKCKCELRVGVTDLIAHQFIIVDQNNPNLGDYVVASLSLPTVLPPVKIENKLYVDGGVINNYPITEALKFGADTIHLVSTNPWPASNHQATTDLSKSRTKMFIYAPPSDLGSLLDFNQNNILNNITLGRKTASIVYRPFFKNDYWKQFSYPPH